MLGTPGSSARTDPRERLFVALDTADPAQARYWVRRLDGRVGGFKIGLELFCAAGPAFLEEVAGKASVFCDLKLHDIPNTAAGAAAAIARCGARYFTVHASGGAEMMRRAVAAATEAAGKLDLPPPRALAVTVLTSHDESTLAEVGLGGPCDQAVVRLATLARTAGVAGLVCSAGEIAAARRAFPAGLLAVPGIRPDDGGRVAGDDQARTATPERVVALGADLLVIGRPITRAADPAAAAERVVAAIARIEPAATDRDQD